ncbi:MAG TPA: cyclopropane-fatty-acyl-phospholipid synthase family protein [Pseudomonadales bacterium]|nr:cyclopropane-fatty-acyl-phospholipid synthase family protein [Pseudomonadales bacterium]
MEIVASSQPSGWLQRMAKRKVFDVLHHIEHGCVTLHEDGQSQVFGQRDAELQAHIYIDNQAFYWAVLSGGSIGAAEAYVEGLWRCDNLTAVIQIFARAMNVVDKLEAGFAWLRMPIEKLRHMANRNSKSGSRTNIAAHYDLGNDMYQTFLDPHMQYSSAIFPHGDATLDQAQEHKLKVICEQLELQPSDHLVEIGTGWGGLACYAAKHYGCRVTTTTLSKEQLVIAKQRAVDEGIEQQIEFLLTDYRDMQGRYDKLVSIEMIEAVGHEYLGSYFAKLNDLLKPGGKMLIQAITIADQRYDTYRKGVDFIQRYIFPGGCLPSLSEMLKHIKQRTHLNVMQLNSYAKDYADTLLLWEKAFTNASKQLTEMGYNRDFQRLWQFYFAYCEAGFREETINLIHLQASKPRHI